MPIPLRTLPARIIFTEEEMLAEPIRRKERKNKTPEKIMDNFLPAKLREKYERLLLSMAPMAGRETANYNDCI